MTEKPGILAIIGRIRDALSPAQRRRAVALLGWTFAESLLDVFGLALVPPLVYLVSDLSVIRRHPALSRLQAILGLEDPRQLVLVLVCGVFVTFIVRHAFGLWVLHRQYRFSYDVALDISRRRFVSHLAMDYEGFRRIPSSVATRDIATIPFEFATGVLVPCGLILIEGLVVTWILIGIVLIDPRVMLLMGLVILPPVLATQRLVRGRLQASGDRRVAARAEAYRVLAQGLFGFSDVRLSDRGAHFVGRSMASFEQLYRAEEHLVLLGHLPRQLVELSAVAGIAALIAYTMVVDQPGAELITVLALLVTAAYRVMPSMTRLLTAFTRMKSSTYVFDLLPPPAAADSDGGHAVRAPSVPFEKDLVVDDVSFTYEGGAGFALRGVSFTIRRGEKIGFVGPSGSGKTTVMNLVLRFIREQAGEIRVDGRRLAPADDRGWQRLLGYVQQDPYLMDGTFAENVAFGEGPAEIDRARVEAALKAASLEDLVATLPRGMDTLIGEFGSTLSGGQRQRIAIARALYRNAFVLVLDEATSALDADTESDVIETVLALNAERGTTVLIIAHHGAMLGICDRVYQLDAGRIVGQATGRDPRAAGVGRNGA